MKVKLLFAWYDIWAGAYWDRKNKLLYILPIPCFGVVIKFIKKKKDFECYEIGRPNIPSGGCKEQCKECEEKQLVMDFLKDCK